jgi:hypothetical protein
MEHCFPLNKLISLEHSNLIFLSAFHYCTFVVRRSHINNSVFLWKFFRRPELDSGVTNDIQHKEYQLIKCETLPELTIHK